MLALRSNLQRVITAARGRINDLEKEDIEARTLPQSAGRRAKANIIRVAGAAIHGRVKRSRHRGALAGAKAPGAHEPDAFDEASGERSPRREGVGDDDPCATMVSEASPSIAVRRPETPPAKVRHRRRSPSYDFHRKVPIQISRPPKTASGTATDPIPVLLERAGDIAVNEGEIAEKAIANAEARNTASTVPPSM
jgi:hypothetical protein